jgi:hypothetical protein
MERREHHISATYYDGSPDARFSDLVRDARRDFLARVVVNGEPPPDREVALVLGLSSYNQMRRSRLDKVFGLIFEEGLCLDGSNLRPAFLDALQGLLNRALGQNHNLKHSGLSVGVFIRGRSEEEITSIFGPLYDFCLGVSNLIDFEILEDEHDLRFFLKDSFRRIVHGDTKAEYEAEASLT